MTDLRETYLEPNGLPIGFDKRFTLTNELTDVLTNDLQDQGSNRLVPNAPTPVDKAIIRRRYSWMYGTPGMYWRVSHPSIPQGSFLGGSVHLYSFADAIEYANALVCREGVAS